jgi:hypothetical protein
LDLSNFAGIYILCIIGGGGLLAWGGYKMQGASGAGCSVLLSVVGMWISLIIVELNAFDDASIETVSTILLCSPMLSIIYNLSLFPKWKITKRNEKIREKIQCFEKEINSLEKELKYCHTIVNLIGLIKKCGGDLREIENNKEFVDASKINEDIKNKRRKIEQLQYKLRDI